MGSVENDSSVFVLQTIIDRQPVKSVESINAAYTDAVEPRLREQGRSKYAIDDSRFCARCRRGGHLHSRGSAMYIDTVPCSEKSIDAL